MCVDSSRHVYKGQGNPLTQTVKALSSEYDAVFINKQTLSDLRSLSYDLHACMFFSSDLHVDVFPAS